MRVPVSESATATPFLGLGFAHAEIDGFTEADPLATGGNLTVHDSDGDSFASVLGVRLVGSTNGTFRPEGSIAWRHEFDDEIQSVDMSFAQGPAGADFTVISSQTSQDSVLVELGGTLIIDENTEFSLRYNGWFSGDYTSNSASARGTHKF